MLIHLNAVQEWSQNTRGFIGKNLKSRNLINSLKMFVENKLPKVLTSKGGVIIELSCFNCVFNYGDRWVHKISIIFYLRLISSPNWEKKYCT